MTKEKAEEEIEEKNFLPCQEIKQTKWRIYDQEFAKEGFDAATLTLDGTLHSTLHWEKEIKKAQNLIEQGMKIFWKLECGFFHSLVYPLAHSSQFLSFTLALKHFYEKIWLVFQKETIGVSLYEGKADFSLFLKEDKEQQQSYQTWLKDLQLKDTPFLHKLFCRDVCLHYLSLLAAYLPDSLPVFLLLDASDLTDQLRLLNPGKFERFQLILKGNLFSFQTYGWQIASCWGLYGSFLQPLPLLEEPLVGVCIPFEDYRKEEEDLLEKVLLVIQKKVSSIRLIAENQLTLQWEGLDEIIYDPNYLSVQGKRKLQGFCAAGGTVVSIREKKGFSQERSLAD